MTKGHGIHPAGTGDDPVASVVSQGDRERRHGAEGAG